MVEIERASAIINRNAGSSRLKKLINSPERVKRKLQKEAQKRGIDLKVEITGSVAAAEKAIKESIAREDDALFVFGGDGTDKDAVKKRRELVPDAKPEDLGVLVPVPYGSISLFGRSLGIPRSVRRLFSAIDKGKIRQHLIDHGTVSIDGKPPEEFISNAGAGPLVAEPFKVVDRSKNKIGGIMRHLRPLPGIIRRAEHLTGEIVIDNLLTMNADASTDLAVQNAGPIGPFILGPKEKYNEGELYIIVADGIFGRQNPRLNTIATAAGVIFDSLPSRQGKPSIAERRFHGREIVLHNLQRSVVVSADGTYIGDAKERVEFRIKERSLSVAAKQGRRSRRCLVGEGEKIVWKKSTPSTSN